MSDALRLRLLAPVLVLATIVTAIISSLGAPLIPTVAHDMHTTLGTAQWSLTVTLLTGAVSAPVMGRLGDGPHRRATIIGGLALVTAGGVVAALASDLAVLVVGRALQGVGLGLVPLAMAAARDGMPTPRVAPTIALLSICAAAGVGAGYPISGVIADSLGLAGAFWFGAIFSAVALVCVALVVPSNAQVAKARLDFVGAGLLSTGLTALLLGVAQGSTWGWSSGSVLALLGVAVVTVGAWVVQQLRVGTPLIELRLLRHPAVLTSNACALVLGMAMYMLISVVTEFVQVAKVSGFGFGASVVSTGLCLIPFSILSLSVSRLLPVLIRALGQRALLSVGSLVVALSPLIFTLFHGSFWEAFLTMGVLGLGLGSTFAAIPGLIVSAIPASETGSAMGFYQVVRYVGFSLGSALTTAVLAGHTPAGAAQPSLGGYTLVMWMSTGICVVAAAVPWLLPVRPAQPAVPAESVAARGGA